MDWEIRDHLKGNSVQIDLEMQQKFKILASFS